MPAKDKKMVRKFSSKSVELSIALPNSVEKKDQYILIDEIYKVDHMAIDYIQNLEKEQNIYKNSRFFKYIVKNIEKISISVSFLSIVYSLIVLVYK